MQKYNIPKEYVLFPMLGNKGQLLGKKVFTKELKDGKETYFIDLFGGTGAVSFYVINNKEGLKKIVINELHPLRNKLLKEIINNPDKFYKGVVRLYKKIEPYLKKYKNNPEKRKEILKKILSPLIDKDNIYAYYLAQLMNANNVPINTSKDFNPDVGYYPFRGYQRLLSLKKQLDFIKNLIKKIKKSNIKIYKQDAWKLAGKLKIKNGIYYLDPDYIGSSKSYLDKSKEDQNLKIFVDKVKNLIKKIPKGNKIVITNNYYKELEDALKRLGFKTKKVKRKGTNRNYKQKFELIAVYVKK